MTTDELGRGERTRLAILEAAQQLFVENGYGGTSMRQIAERAGGIAVGGIYNHFASKQDILYALIKVRSPTLHMVAALEEIQGESGPEMLATALRRLSAVAIQHIDFIQLAYIDLQLFEGAAMTEMMGEMLPAVVSFGERVLQAGGLRPEVSPFALMRTFASLMIGFAVTQRIGFAEGQPRVPIIPDVPPEEWIDALTDIFLRGVAAVEG